MTYEEISFDFQCGKRLLRFSERTHIMGVLNVTPDSFSDGGKYLDPERAVDRAHEMVSQGADIIDVGGESSRPKGPYGEGAEIVSDDEEIGRVVPVIERIAGSSDVPISIDTYKSTVAEAALHAGASIVNDISGLTHDPLMASVIAKHRGALIAMHMKGTPKTMQADPQYGDVVREVKSGLADSVKSARWAGIEHILIDPGIGFGKNIGHNLTLIRHLGEFRSLGCPIVIGPSRKAFIGTLLNSPVGDRLEGTAAAVAAAIIAGANVVRVHDVREMKRVAIVADAVLRAT
ncbi:MAG TPA: dihydropteroate synthase [Bacteroidota bacterium]|nr:dihydropteroate synthase [Bacteroidota bacterium]